LIPILEVVHVCVTAEKQGHTHARKTVKYLSVLKKTTLSTMVALPYYYDYLKI
jgi:hypothetical protein